MTRDEILALMLDIQRGRTRVIEPESDGHEYCVGCGRSPYNQPPHIPNCVVPRLAAYVSELLAVETGKMNERATELEWLTWFIQNADFGPADGDVKREMRAEFQEKTGKRLPKGWDHGEDC